MAHPVPERELWLGLIMAGGFSIAWLRDLGLSDPAGGFEALEALAAGAPPGADGLTFRPFLEGTATPWARPDARAGFDGLTTRHGPHHLARGVYEGVAYNIRACVEAFEDAGACIERVRLAEGGARSAFWSRMIADVLARPVERVVENDTSAVGAAVLALAGVSGDDVDEMVGSTIRVGRTTFPDAARRVGYEAGYGLFRERCADVASPRVPARDATPAAGHDPPVADDHAC